MGRTVINETENKQTIILNDSPEGVSGGYFDDEMVWHEMGGSSDDLVIRNMSGSTNVWRLQKLPNFLKENKSLKVTCTGGVISSTYQNMLDVGLDTQISTYGHANVIHFYHNYTADNNKIVVHTGVGSGTSDIIDVSGASTYTIEITPDGIFVNGTKSEIGVSGLSGLDEIGLGSTEGNTRFQGMYTSIIVEA